MGRHCGVLHGDGPGEAAEETGDGSGQRLVLAPQRVEPLQAEAPQDGEIGRTPAGADAAGVRAQRHVRAVVRHLDAPRPAPPGSHPPPPHPPGADERALLARRLLALLLGDVDDVSDRPQPFAAVVPTEAFTCARVRDDPDGARVASSMPLLADRDGLRCGGIQAEHDLVAERRRVAFHRHKPVAASSAHQAERLAAAVRRVEADKGAVEAHVLAAQQLARRWHLLARAGGGHRRQYPLGVRVDGVDHQCRLHAVGPGGAAAARLAVDRDVPRPRRRPAPRHEPAPRLHRLVERVRIGRRHDAADCAMARKLLQPKCPQQSFHPPWPVPGDVVPEPHHRRRPLRGEHHRHRDHGQHPSVAVPQRRTRRPRILQPFELLSGVLDQALHHRLQSFLLGSFRPGFACQAVAMSYTMAVGYQGALTLVRHVLLRPGDPVWIEDPGYHLARQALETAGARVIPVRVDQDGLRVASGAAAAPRAKLAVVTPTHQCPTGVALSLPRRLELLAWAAEAGSWILEDDYDSEYRYTGRPLPALKSLDRGARVLYAGSFSKTLF